MHVGLERENTETFCDHTVSTIKIKFHLKMYPLQQHKFSHPKKCEMKKSNIRQKSELNFWGRQ